MVVDLTGPPPRIQPRLKSAPKIGMVYWCDFPNDAQLPEMWKRRPVIILSPRNTLFGAVTIVPLTTKSDNATNQWAVKIASPLSQDDSWALCNYPTTIAVSRLTQTGRTIPKIAPDELNNIVERVLTWLPAIKKLDNQK